MHDHPGTPPLEQVQGVVVTSRWVRKKTKKEKEWVGGERKRERAASRFSNIEAARRTKRSRSNEMNNKIDVAVRRREAKKEARRRKLKAK